MDTCPSGCQVEIAYNDQRATVVEVGGGIRRYEVSDRPVFDSFPIDTIFDGGRGAPLIPWPNRLADGQYRFNDEHQLPAGTEPVDGTAYDFRESRLLGATTLAAFGHHPRSATQVDAVTVAAGGSYITTRDLIGFSESADGTHMSEKGRSYLCDRRS